MPLLSSLVAIGAGAAGAAGDLMQESAAQEANQAQEQRATGAMKLKSLAPNVPITLDEVPSMAAPPVPPAGLDTITNVSGGSVGPIGAPVSAYPTMFAKVTQPVEYSAKAEFSLNSGIIAQLLAGDPTSPDYKPPTIRVSPAIVRTDNGDKIEGGPGTTIRLMFDKRTGPFTGTLTVLHPGDRGDLGVHRTYQSTAYDISDPTSRQTIEEDKVPYSAVGFHVQKLIAKMRNGDAKLTGKDVVGKAADEPYQAQFKLGKTKLGKQKKWEDFCDSDKDKMIIKVSGRMVEPLGFGPEAVQAGPSSPPEPEDDPDADDSEYDTDSSSDDTEDLNPVSQPTE